VKKGLEQLKPGNKNIFIARTTTYATEASLADVTSKALELLKNPDGFFLMVEGGAIDGSNHSNCSVGMMNEMIEFDKTIARVLDFAAKHPEETLVVVTADHDTGGLQLDGKVPVGFWKKSSHTYNTINRALQKMRAAKASKEKMIDFACKAAGIEVPVSGKAAEVINAAADRFVDGKQTEKGSMYGKYNPLVVAVLHARDAQNNFHYTTFSHTPAKVPTFALGNGSRLFVAPMENSDIPRRISIAATGVDLLEQYNGVQPFPPAAKNDFHFTVQSVTENSIVCRYNLANEQSIKITLSGNGRNVVREMKEPWGRVTFDKLSPDTEYTVSCEKNSIKVRTLPALADVSVTGAVIADPHCSTAPDNPLQRMHSRSEELLNDAAKAVKEAKIDVLLVPGDITDKSRPAEFKIFMDAFKKAPYKILATPGNHDKLTKENSSRYKRVFKNPAGYCDINGIQFVTLNTWNGKLDNPGNANAIEKLDVSRPAIIQSHYQLKKSNNTIVDNNSAIKDSNKPAVRKMLDKIANSHSLILVGHKNAAEKVVIGKNALQINCPQLTQYPCGYLTFKANKDGVAISYKPAASVAVEERS
ncbi:MAG: alkaline phosphatase, partial [Lentisphaeria bacterium]|nr:alkaline phosphatase [Lentisphaeria bacterium]